jgi:hypothetical protein
MVEWKLNVSMTCHGVLKIAPQVFVRGFFRSLLILLRQFLSNTLKSRDFLTHYAFP